MKQTKSKKFDPNWPREIISTLALFLFFSIPLTAMVSLFAGDEFATPAFLIELFGSIIVEIIGFFIAVYVHESLSFNKIGVFNA